MPEPTMPQPTGPEYQPAKDQSATKPKHGAAKAQKRRLASRFSLVLLAIVVGAAMIGGSLVYAAKKRDTTKQGSFDTSKVLPQAVTIPPSSPNKEFTAETIKQYDGKDGHKCYAAVDGIVYEIADKGQWKNGEHLPSGGEAYCGADLSEAIKHAPHGTTKLEELPKVGTYKAS